jgi:hypothetical protein
MAFAPGKYQVLSEQMALLLGFPKMSIPTPGMPTGTYNNSVLGREENSIPQLAGIQLAEIRRVDD